MLPLITPTTLALLAGAVHLLLSTTVWMLLRRRGSAARIHLWSAGSLGFGIGTLMIAARPVLPFWVGHVLANCLLLVAQLMCIASLRISLGLAARSRLMAALAAAGCATHLLMLALDLPELRIALSSLTLAATAGAISHYALITGRQLSSRSAYLLAGLEGAKAFALVLRGISVAAGWVPAAAIDSNPSAWLLVPIVLACALYGNLGYLGLELDRLGVAEVQAHRARLAEAARREAAEHSANDLRKALDERDQLAAERDQLLQMLAHEIRQPLHNASGALQAAAMLVQSSGAPTDATQLSARLERAQGVLADVRSVLDNTLAATLMLTRRDPLVVQDVDLHLLVHLVLGDLADAQRVRTEVAWCTPLRSAEVEPGLVRLALRNLLRNAFEHGGPEVHVTLRIEEQESPAAMVLTVADDGPGRTATGSEDDRMLLVQGASGAPRRGLGLVIVRRVMALHRGQLQMLPNGAKGLQARLIFPDPTDAASDLPEFTAPVPAEAGAA